MKKLSFSRLRSFLFTVLISVLLIVFVLFRQREWRQPGQRAVLIVQEGQDEVRRPLTIAISDPETPKLVLMPLPRNQYVAAAVASYGTYQTDALVGLTQLEKLDWAFLKQTVTWEYGVVIDGVVWTKASTVASLADVAKIAQAGIVNSLPTTLTYWDRWAWYQQLAKIPSYQGETVKLSDWLQPEGQLQELSYDAWAERTIQDSQVRRANLSVVVQNASGVQGQASRVARALRLIGFGVRNIETLPEQSNTKILLSPDLKRTEPVVRWGEERLKRLFPYAGVEENSEITQRARADMVLLLGTDQREALTLHRRQGTLDTAR